MIGPADGVDTLGLEGRGDSSQLLPLGHRSRDQRLVVKQHQMVALHHGHAPALPIQGDITQGAGHQRGGKPLCRERGEGHLAIEADKIGGDQHQIRQPPGLSCQQEIRLDLARLNLGDPYSVVPLLIEAGDHIFDHVTGLLGVPQLQFRLLSLQGVAQCEQAKQQEMIKESFSAHVIITVIP